MFDAKKLIDGGGVDLDAPHREEGEVLGGFGISRPPRCLGRVRALAGVLVLGPRKGKYGKDGSIHAIPGANMPLATLGTFILWMGWFGFNGGSVLSADPELTSLVLVRMI